MGDRYARAGILAGPPVISRRKSVLPTHVCEAATGYAGDQKQSFWTPHKRLLAAGGFGVHKLCLCSEAELPAFEKGAGFRARVHRERKLRLRLEAELLELQKAAAGGI